MSAYEKIVAALETHGTVKGAGDGRVIAQCPAHPDNNPSLSVKAVEGRALVFCHAHCDTRDVMTALGLHMRDMFDEGRAEYRYESGRVVTRYYNHAGKKTFPQSGDTSKVELYRLDRIRNAGPGAILLVEGEEDVRAIESLGAVATTAPMGARNVGKCDLSPLHGRDVIAIADRDLSGLAWAQEVQRLLAGKAKSLRFGQAKEGNDPADHIAAGHGLNDWVPLELEPESEPETQAEEPTGRKVKLTRASTIGMRATLWLWEEAPAGTFVTPDAPGARWLPLGGLCLLGGREGVGKSTWAYRIAAQITSGTLPGEFHGKPRGVAVAATEDAWQQTIVPRLVAAGADLDRVFRADVEDEGQTTGLTLPSDISGLRDACREEGVALLLLDPLMGTLSGALDSHKDHDVRLALEPLSRLAHDADITVLGLIHVNKSTGGDLLTRLMASRAFSAVARAVLFATREEAEEEGAEPTFLLGQVKSNLGPGVPHSIRYHLEGAKVGHDERLDRDIWSSRVVVDALVDSGVQELVREQENRAPGRETATDRAKKWLREYLDGRGAVPSKTVKRAAEEAGHKESTLKRAMGQLEVYVSSIPGTTKETTWALSKPELTEPTDLTDLSELTELTDQNGTKEGVSSVGSVGADPPRARAELTDPTAEDHHCEMCQKPIWHPGSIKLGLCAECRLAQTRAAA